MAALYTVTSADRRSEREQDADIEVELQCEVWLDAARPRTRPQLLDRTWNPRERVELGDEAHGSTERLRISGTRSDQERPARHRIGVAVHRGHVELDRVAYDAAADRARDVDSLTRLVE